MWPLDGGQATQIILSFFDRAQANAGVTSCRSGLRDPALPSWCSVTDVNDLFLTIFFAYFAIINFQALQSIHQAQAMGLYQEDEWWRR